MVTTSIDPAGCRVFTQRCTIPTLYLDHWALRELSESHELSARFVHALHAVRGTLALSVTNVLEFCHVTDERQTASAEAFIDASLPNVFFLEMNPFEVISREDALLAGNPSVAPPHQDRELFQTFLQLEREVADVFTAHGLLNGVRERLSQSAAELADMFVERVSALRAELAQDAGLQARLRRPAQGWSIQHGTRFILRELVRGLTIDRMMRLSRNDAIDFLHAGVPVAYCDLVLLDKKWEDQIGRLRKRLSEAGVAIPLARVISKRSGGIEELVATLETACL